MNGSDEEEQVEEPVVMKGDRDEACAVNETTPLHQLDLRVK
jgi:hypothetical protein